MAALPNYVIENWCEFGLGAVVILLRVFVRTRMVGFRGWKGDDYLILFALANFTLQMTMHQVIFDKGMNYNLSEEQIAAMTPQERHTMRVGTISNFVCWIVYFNLCWSLKGSMLFFYARLCSGLDEERRIFWTAVTVVVTYFGCWLTLIFHCGSASLTFAIKPHLHCTAEYPMLYAITIFNLITDMLLLWIPIRIVRMARLTLKRKIMVAALLCGGVLTITITFINALLSILFEMDDLDKTFGGKLYSQSYLSFAFGMGLRETFVAVIVVNAPCIKPLFSRRVWFSKPAPELDLSTVHQENSARKASKASMKKGWSSATTAVMTETTTFNDGKLEEAQPEISKE